MPTELPVLSRNLTPTDISQFNRLSRCERFLRLRMHERSAGQGFLKDFDVAPQSIAPLLTRSGRDFEESAEDAMRARFPLENYADDAITVAGRRQTDNDRLLRAACSLTPGDTRIITQPRIKATLGGWHIRGDLDILRLSRDESGRLSLLIADAKSSTSAKVEHRLQVAFYNAMLAEILAGAGIVCERIETAVLYRGPTDGTGEAKAQELAEHLLGVTNAYMEVVADAEAYLMEVRDLTEGDDSVAGRIAAMPFESLFFTLDLKCDGCLYNEFCLKESYLRGDLSLVPYLTARDKRALLDAGVTDVAGLAALKDLPFDEASGRSAAMEPAPGQEEVITRLAATAAGPHLDELVLRARRTGKARPLGLPSLPYIPHRGHSTLPFSGPDHNPNLIRIFVDVQHDYLNDRIYMAGALIVACEDGQPVRRRAVVHMTPAPPDTARKEEALFAGWVSELLEAVIELAAVDAIGARRAPLHLIFWNDFGQRLLLDALARNFSSMVAAAPALYDFVTQIAAFDSPIASFLDAEIREHKNYPMLCQSLQAVAAYRGFDWRAGTDFRNKFRERLFDGGGRIGEEAYPRRSRHNSQIPLEFAYAAWGDLDDQGGDGADPFAAYRSVTADDLTAFQARRLEAIEHVSQDFPGNRLTEKTPFDLPDLARFAGRAHHLADALREFITIERHVELASWKAGRQMPAGRRALTGETLLVQYREEDQEPDVAEQNRENERRRLLKDRYYVEYRQANPLAERVRLPKDQADECRWSMTGMRFRLRLVTDGADCDLDTLLALCDLEPGDWLLLYPQIAYDGRLPLGERTPNQPTPKQMLYGTRVELTGLTLERDTAGAVTAGLAEVQVVQGMGSSKPIGYLFNSIDQPLIDGAAYTLDPNPNDIYSLWAAKVAEGLVGLEDIRRAGGKPDGHALYERLASRSPGPVRWPTAAIASQARFLEGLQALQIAGALHDFEPSKRAYIGGHGADPILLVQGPPGTGKSYSTAFAVLARLQGASAAGLGFRAFVSCKTHSATDVLLDALLEVRALLRDRRQSHPDIWDRYFDDRVLDAPLLRLAPRGGPPDGVTALGKDQAKTWAKTIQAYDFCIVGATPGGIYTSVKDAKSLFGHEFCDLLVLDEASQMSLPEAMMAALPLSSGGQLVVVGDPRQMPPIVKHDWECEPRRTFQEYRAYASLFEGLLALGPPMIQFEESFRLHATMAEFLRREVYAQDGIHYHSARRRTLPAHSHPDAFVSAVLSPEHPLVVVVHDEATSQNSNAFEQELISPILRVLADPKAYALGAAEGLGVVVPHRAQRVALRRAFPDLRVIDEETQEVLTEAIDTVERYQGEERDVILVSATESDRYYLQVSGAFLLEPRRLTVALSRAKKKMVLVASRSVFSYFSNDEQLFLNSLLWKNLLRRTCTEPLWAGERAGQKVTVWGTPVNSSAPD